MCFNDVNPNYLQYKLKRQVYLQKPVVTVDWCFLLLLASLAHLLFQWRCLFVGCIGTDRVFFLHHMVLSEQYVILLTMYLFIEGEKN